MNLTEFTNLSWNFVRRAAAPRFLVAGLTLCACSCSSVNQYVKKTFQKEDAAVAEQDLATEGKNTTADAHKAADAPEKEVKHAYASSQKPVDKKAESQEKPPTKEVAATETKAPASESSPSSDWDEFLANRDTPPASDSIRQTVEEVVAEERATSKEPAIQHAPEPRTAANPFASPPVSCPPCTARPFPSLEYVGDEYVCDGGDKGLPVHYDGENRLGLDTDDTVAEYVDHLGNQHVKPSSEACVYAPRFGAVRSSTLPVQGERIDKALGHQDQLSASGFQARALADEQRQADEAVGIDMRSRASGLASLTAEERLHQATRASNHVKLINVYEDFGFLRDGQFDKANPAVITQGMDAAQEWADGRRPIIVAHNQGGQIIQGRYMAQDYTGVEDMRKIGELTIIKVADKAAAHAGDVVTFTIRFDNVGDRELLGVRVVDNLSPRLEYIEGSIYSNLDGQIDVQDNGAGGKLLTFEFEQPLQGQTGGYVSFQCRVR